MKNTTGKNTKTNDATTKNVNYLGSLLEKQKQFRLPFQRTVNELTHLTTLVKQSLQSVLPNEAIAPLVVIHNSGQSLIVSTPNYTVANHLNYMSQAILSLLHNDHPQLQRITQLKFKVILTAHRFTQADLPPSLLKRNQSVNNVTSRELSERTRQNITQLANLVTNNPRLKSILESMANEKK